MAENLKTEPPKPGDISYAWRNDPGSKAVPQKEPIIETTQETVKTAKADFTRTFTKDKGNGGVLGEIKGFFTGAPQYTEISAQETQQPGPVLGAAEDPNAVSRYWERDPYSNLQPVQPGNAATPEQPAAAATPTSEPQPVSQPPVEPALLFTNYPPETIPEPIPAAAQAQRSEQVQPLVSEPLQPQVETSEWLSVRDAYQEALEYTRLARTNDPNDHGGPLNQHFDQLEVDEALGHINKKAWRDAVDPVIKAEKDRIARAKGENRDLSLKAAKWVEYLADPDGIEAERVRLYGETFRAQERADQVRESIKEGREYKDQFYNSPWPDRRAMQSEQKQYENWQMAEARQAYKDAKKAYEQFEKENIPDEILEIERQTSRLKNAVTEFNRGKATPEEMDMLISAGRIKETDLRRGEKPFAGEYELWRRYQDAKEAQPEPSALRKDYDARVARWMNALRNKNRPNPASAEAAQPPAQEEENGNGNNNLPRSVENQTPGQSPLNNVPAGTSESRAETNVPADNTVKPEDVNVQPNQEVLESRAPIGTQPAAEIDEKPLTWKDRIKSAIWNPDTGLRLGSLIAGGLARYVATHSGVDMATADQWVVGAGLVAGAARYGIFSAEAFSEKVRNWEDNHPRFTTAMKRVTESAALGGVGWVGEGVLEQQLPYLQSHVKNGQNPNYPGSAGTGSSQKEVPPLGTSGSAEVLPAVHGTAANGAIVNGSVQSGDLFYNGHRWELFSNGLKNAEQIFHNTPAEIDAEKFKYELQQAAQLWTDHKLPANSDLWRVFHFSNGTRSVFADLSQTHSADTLKAFKNLGILK